MLPITPQMKILVAKAILHRKNAPFYKTPNGASVGDLFMSLIYGRQLNQANPFDCLTQLQRHAEAFAACPRLWMPWDYREAMARALTARAVPYRSISL